MLTPWFTIASRNSHTTMMKNKNERGSIVYGWFNLWNFFLLLLLLKGEIKFSDRPSVREWKKFHQGRVTDATSFKVSPLFFSPLWGMFAEKWNDNVISRENPTNAIVIVCNMDTGPLSFFHSLDYPFFLHFCSFFSISAFFPWSLLRQTTRTHRHSSSKRLNPLKFKFPELLMVQ